MEETFSPSHDMTKDVGSREKLLRVQDSFVETWIAVGENGLVQLLKNTYKRRTQH